MFKQVSNKDDYEVVSEHHICDFHKLNPGQQHPACTCGGSYYLKGKEKNVKE